MLFWILSHVVHTLLYMILLQYFHHICTMHSIYLYTQTHKGQSRIQVIHSYFSRAGKRTSGAWDIQPYELSAKRVRKGHGHRWHRRKWPRLEPLLKATQEEWSGDSQGQIKDMQINEWMAQAPNHVIYIEMSTTRFVALTFWKLNFNYNKSVWQCKFTQFWIVSSKDTMWKVSEGDCIQSPELVMWKNKPKTKKKSL